MNQLLFKIHKYDSLIQVSKKTLNNYTYIHDLQINRSLYMWLNACCEISLAYLVLGVTLYSL